MLGDVVDAEGTVGIESATAFTAAGVAAVPPFVLDDDDVESDSFR